MQNNKAEEFRRRAEEAEEWADSSGNVEERTKFEEIARQYRDLAGRVEKQSPGGLTIDLNLPPNDTPREIEH